MKEQTKKRVLPLALLGVGLLAIIAMIAIRPAPRREEPPVRAPLVRVVPALVGTIALKVNAQGTVMPRTASDLVAEVAGRVEWVSPALVSGGAFEAGEALVRIEGADYEAELESARAAVARAESEASRAGKELRRQRKLAKNSVASQSRIDDAENANRIAQASLREARARRARAERDLDRTELRAPYTGRVRSESVDVGQFVNRGVSIGRLYAVDYAEVRLPLPDRELAYLDADVLTALGGESTDRPAVRLTAEFAGKTHSWMGEIVRSEGEIDARSRMVHVVARVEDPYGLKTRPAPVLSGEASAPEGGEASGSSPADPSGGAALPDEPAQPAELGWKAAPEPGSAPLAVGLYVEAEIEGRNVHGAYVLPREALHDHRGSSGNVWVVDDEDRLRARAVEVLRAQRNVVVITDGLAPGERVSVSRLRAPVDGMAVRVAGQPEARARATARSASPERGAGDPASASWDEGEPETLEAEAALAEANR